VPQTDQQLIDSANKGDNSAYEQLYQRHVRLLHGYLYKRLGSAADADDICQEAFIKAFQKLGQYRGDASFKNWLFQIAKNLIVDHWRSQSKCTTVPIDEFFNLGREPITPEAEAAEIKSQERTAKQLNNILNQLPEDYRKIIELRFLQGCSIREAANQIGISEANAKVRQYRAIKKAQDLLKNE